MPRIEVATESLPAGGAAQSAAGGQALEAAGAREAAIPRGHERPRSRARDCLDVLVAHWRVEGRGPEAGWCLEVLDAELGLCTVDEPRERRLKLTLTNATAVLDELSALPAHIGLGPAR